MSVLAEASIQLAGFTTRLGGDSAIRAIENIPVEIQAGALAGMVVGALLYVCTGGEKRLDEFSGAVGVGAIVGGFIGWNFT